MFFYAERPHGILLNSLPPKIAMTGQFQSPLRYPGGKVSLAGLLEATIELNGVLGAPYFEPFAGGAGAALALLKSGAVSELRLNDLDARVYAFWRAALNQTSELIDRVASTTLSITEWSRQREICRTPSRYSQIDVGFAAFYMNRCNRSGVLTGAGPIGGYSQKGKWQLDARFDREELCKRIEWLGNNRSRISISRMDAIEFLTESLPRGELRSNCFVYLDPPYVVKGQRLYLNAYEMRDHRKLAAYLNRQQKLKWFMSYDDTELIRRLYEHQDKSLLSIDYKLNHKRSANELIITPRSVLTPECCKIAGKDRRLIAVA